MRSDGSEFPVELTITRIEGAEPPTFTGYIRDISERRAAERNSAAQYAVAGVLAEARTVEEAMPRLLQALGASMDWELGAAWQVDEQAGGLRCTSLWQTDGIDAAEFRELSGSLVVERGAGPLGRVWQTGAPASSEDAALEPGYPRADAAAREGLRGALWMGAPRARAGPPGRVHPARRGDRRDRHARTVGHRGGVRAGGAVARRAR